MVCIVIRSSCHGPMPGELDKGFLCDLSQILGSKQVSMGKNSDPLEENQLSSQKHKAPSVPWVSPVRSPSVSRGGALLSYRRNGLMGKMPASQRN